MGVESRPSSPMVLCDSLHGRVGRYQDIHRHHTKPVIERWQAFLFYTFKVREGQIIKSSRIVIARSLIAGLLKCSLHDMIANTWSNHGTFVAER